MDAEPQGGRLRQRTTRRAMMATNIKAIGAVAAAAIVASLANTTPAMARTCFLRGTKIRTALGERPVEELAVGDYLPTVFGGVRRIQWITRSRQIRGDDGKPWKKHAQAVRIATSALAPNVP